MMDPAGGSEKGAPRRLPGTNWLTLRRTGGPLSFAHRGGAALWPENTLIAFRGALSLGVGCIETDLHMTRDGVLVLAHDSTLDRTTDGTGSISELDFANIAERDAGFRFESDDGQFPFRGQGLKVPQFSELAELDGDFVINVEIKSDDPRIPEALCKQVSHYGLVERVIVASEDQGRLTRFRRIAARHFGTRGRRGVLATSASRFEVVRSLAAARLGFTALIRPRFDALQVPVRSGNIRVITPHLVAWAHKLGVQVHAWTINDEQEMRALLNLGVDGLMTDYPDRLKATLQNLQHSPTDSTLEGTL